MLFGYSFFLFFLSFLAILVTRSFFAVVGGGGVVGVVEFLYLWRTTHIWLLSLSMPTSSCLRGCQEHKYSTYIDAYLLHIVAL